MAREAVGKGKGNIGHGTEPRRQVLDIGASDLVAKCNKGMRVKKEFLWFFEPFFVHSA